VAASYQVDEETLRLDSGRRWAQCPCPTVRVGLRVAATRRESSGLREKWGGRRTEGCSRSRRGFCWLTCFRGWTRRRYISRSGRCSGCWGKGRRDGRCGSRNGGCCDARAGRRSGCRCSTGSRRCCGSMNECRREGRSLGRSESRCSSRSSCCCIRENGGRTRGEDSPCRPGDGAEEAIQSARRRTQNDGIV
jgi:hypothetical protein